MSHIRCPMCGKDSACSTFHPEDLDNDIYVRQATGLGRGAGFSFGSDESVLGDTIYTPKVMYRCMELLNAIIENGSITKREVVKELKIGFPIEGRDDVLTHEEIVQMDSIQIKYQERKIESLERQVSRAQSGVSIYEYERLIKRCEDLERYVRMKKNTDEVLLLLNSALDSEIFLEGDDWVLKVNEWDPLIFRRLCKKIYPLSREEREVLRSRIKTGSFELLNIFQIFRGEPTIRSMTDRWTAKPGALYYWVHNLPFPNYL